MCKASIEQNKGYSYFVQDSLFLEQSIAQFWPLSDTQVIGTCWVADRYFWWHVLKRERTSTTAASLESESIWEVWLYLLASYCSTCANHALMRTFRNLQSSSYKFQPWGPEHRLCCRKWTYISLSKTSSCWVRHPHYRAHPGLVAVFSGKLCLLPAVSAPHWTPVSGEVSGREDSASQGTRQIHPTGCMNDTYLVRAVLGWEHKGCSLMDHILHHIYNTASGLCISAWDTAVLVGQELQLSVAGTDPQEFCHEPLHGRWYSKWLSAVSARGIFSTLRAKGWV